eukprot:TRINITY_DN67_c0_g1_i3.p1 TRINITY_DN67_c0_g1~~TRINITY_DN67_c0_g1_i3.p1  ORF type:complete len:307 (-),score=45.08 TRINITY_DN67_c0_g1_i3:251-1171(-)
MRFAVLLSAILGVVFVSADTHCQAGYIDGKPSCYKDDWGNPILQYWAYTLKSNELTLETCMAACHEQNPDYKIFGIENGADQSNAECWCGNSPNYPASGPITGCNAPCPGNSAEVCGGSGTLMSLYSIVQCSSSPVPPPVSAAPAAPIAAPFTPPPPPYIPYESDLPLLWDAVYGELPGVSLTFAVRTLPQSFSRSMFPSPSVAGEAYARLACSPVIRGSATAQRFNVSFPEGVSTLISPRYTFPTRCPDVLGAPPGALCTSCQVTPSVNPAPAPALSLEGLRRVDTEPSAAGDSGIETIIIVLPQ